MPKPSPTSPPSPGEVETFNTLAEAIAHAIESRDAYRREIRRHGPDCKCDPMQISFCLGLTRCDNMKSGGCQWCMSYPAAEGADYIPTFIHLFNKGH